METPYLDEMINELDGYIGSDTNYLSKKGNKKLAELKAIKEQLLLKTKINEAKQETLNRLEELIDDAVHLYDDSYDRDVLEYIWDLFNPKTNKKQMTIGHGYVGYEFLHYSDEEKRWNKVKVKQVDPDSIDVINIDEDSDEYHNVWTISDTELVNINNCKQP